MIISIPIKLWILDSITLLLHSWASPISAHHLFRLKSIPGPRDPRITGVIYLGLQVLVFYKLFFGPLELPLLLQEKLEYLKEAPIPFNTVTIAFNFVHRPIVGVTTFRSESQLPQNHERVGNCSEWSFILQQFRLTVLSNRVMHFTLQDIQQTVYLLLETNYLSQ